MKLNPHKSENRLIKRYQLNHYLTVYNRNTEREMGGIGNISCNGLMMVSTIPMLVGAVYSMRIMIPNNDNKESMYLDFDARCHWCKPDVNPDFFDSGYSIIENSEEIINLVESLNGYFTFKEE